MVSMPGVKLVEFPLAVFLLLGNNSVVGDGTDGLGTSLELVLVLSVDSITFDFRGDGFVL